MLSCLSVPLGSSGPAQRGGAQHLDVLSTEQDILDQSHDTTPDCMAWCPLRCREASQTFLLSQKNGRTLPMGGTKHSVPPLGTDASHLGKTPLPTPSGRFPKLYLGLLQCVLLLWFPCSQPWRSAPAILLLSPKPSPEWVLGRAPCGHHCSFFRRFPPPWPVPPLSFTLLALSTHSTVPAPQSGTQMVSANTR